MPCNAIATIAIGLKVSTLNELRANPDALQALEIALGQITGQECRPQVYPRSGGAEIYFMLGTGRRYVLLGSNGLQLVGNFNEREQAAIKAFVEGLPAAMAEQAVANALATQLQLLDDQPTYNESGVVIGRTLVVRI